MLGDPPLPPSLRLVGPSYAFLLPKALSSLPRPLTVIEWANPHEAFLARALLHHMGRRPVILYPPEALPGLRSSSSQTLSSLLGLSQEGLEEALSLLQGEADWKEAPPQAISLALFLTHPQVRALLDGSEPVPPTASIHLHLLPSLFRWPQWTLRLLEGVLEGNGRKGNPHFWVARFQHDYWLTAEGSLAPWLRTPALNPEEAFRLLDALTAPSPRLRDLPRRFLLAADQGSLRLAEVAR